MSEPAVLFTDVVIPFRQWDGWCEECVLAALALDPPCQRITLVPDQPIGNDVWRVIREMQGGSRVRELASGPVNPGRKRNLAMENNEADIFGFVDSDARAWPDWLGKGLPHFVDPSIAVVGGPNLTPPEDGMLRKACGDVMASPLGMGAAFIRHTLATGREVTELPTCNLFVRNLPWMRFRPELDTSEDMALCGLVRERKFRVIYDPEVRVYHHRRRLGPAFGRQFHDYGLYQGRRAAWQWIWRAAPLGLLIYLAILSGALWLVPGHWRLFVLPLCLYFVCILAESLRLTRGRPRWLLTGSGFLWAHVAYGLGYLKGWMSARWLSVRARG